MLIAGCCCFCILVHFFCFVVWWFLLQCSVLCIHVCIHFGCSALFMGGRVSGSSQTRCPAMALHVKACCEVYPRTSDVIRFPVPDDMVPWDVDFPGYEPVDYTAPSVEKRPVWADPDFRKEKEMWVVTDIIIYSPSSVISGFWLKKKGQLDFCFHNMSLKLS